ncbi:hypothetical protein DPQ22_05780 [Candidatus Tokpelaia sp.]|nr:hypothetical protein DPQ22_05780 [Candidatus Tokpelaia sp.]
MLYQRLTLLPGKTYGDRGRRNALSSLIPAAAPALWQQRQGCGIKTPESGKFLLPRGRRAGQKTANMQRQGGAKRQGRSRRAFIAEIIFFYNSVFA